MKAILLSVSLLVLISSNSNGQAWVWAKSILGLGNQRVVNGYVVKTDNCNNVYVAGIWKSDSIKIGASTFHNRNVGANNYECYIIKYDSAGNIQWSDASVLGQALPYGIANDYNDNTYLYGCFWTDSVKFGTNLLVNDRPDSCLSPWCSWGSGCYFIIKYNSLGNIVWARKGDVVMGMGGNIVIDSSSNIYVSGAYWNASMVIGGDTLINSSYKKGEIFLAKYDSAGNALWAKDYGDTADEYTNGMAFLKGRLYLTGQYKSPVVSFGPSTLTYHSFVPAYNIGNTYLMQLDTSGNPLWARNCVGSAVSSDVSTDSFGAIYIGGQIFDTTYVSFNTDTLRNSHLRWGGFLVKYDTLGNVDWATGIYNTTTTLTTSGFGQGNKLWSIAIDKCNNVWVSGAISADPGGIDIGSSVILNSPTGSWDPLYLIAYSPAGGVVQSLAIKSGSDNGGKIGLFSDNTGNVYVSSNYRTTLTFASDTLLTNMGTPMYIAKYNPGLGCSISVCPKDNPTTFIPPPIDSSKNDTEVFLFPNPAQSELNVKSKRSITEIIVIDLLGHEIYSQKVDALEATINVANLKEGMYIIKINGLIYNSFIKG